MELKIVEAKKMKSLEDYLIALVSGLISIQTLQSFHEQAVNIGILKEDQVCRANTIVWDLKRLYLIYFQQAESIRELIPEEFNFENLLNKLKETERKTITNKQKKDVRKER